MPAARPRPGSKLLQEVEGWGEGQALFGQERLSPSLKTSLEVVEGAATLDICATEKETSR